MSVNPDVVKRDRARSAAFDTGEDGPNILAQVKVSEDSARALALAKVAGAVESVELVRHEGKLTWIWDIKVSGKRGITEVSVNAIDGSVAAHAE